MEDLSSGAVRGDIVKNTLFSGCFVNFLDVPAMIIPRSLPRHILTSCVVRL